MGAGDRLLCSRVSESCDVVGSLHLFIFVKKIFRNESRCHAKWFLYVPNCAEGDWDWADTAVLVSAL